MAKKELAIVFGVTGNISFTVGNMLLGLKKYLNDRTFDCIIYHLGVSAEDQNVLNAILPCRFIPYDFPVLDSDKYEVLAGKRYTTLSYARFECFALLETYKTVLWLDTDILLVRNLSGLFTLNRTGIALFLQKGSVLGSRFHTAVEGYDLGCEFYNTGVLLLHDNLQGRLQLKDWCYKKTYDLAEISAGTDMGIINLMIKKFNLEIDELP
jgi:lipopolysaccharide biosynthesis glycosyltransferase